MIQLNVNTDELVVYANKMERVHRSALPVAVRGSLNDAAFDMKIKQIPLTFDRQFVERKKNFIKAHTAVNKSKNTFDVNQMASEAGVIAGKSKAGDNLEKQEFGGVIKDRDYIPMTPARVGKSSKKLVSRRFYLKNIKPQKGKKRTRNQQFIRAAIKAGKGGFVRYDDYLFAIRTVKKPSRGGIFIKADPIYSYRKGRSVSVSKASFIEPAGEMSAKKIPAFFIKQAERQLKKIR
jgi:hypothetical protein